MRYAPNNGVFIAYRTVGEGDDVIMTSSATLTMETVWPWVKVVAERSRVTWYDKRGTGASDGVANFSFEERVDDIRAVMDAAGIQRAHLFGSSEGGPQSVISRVLRNSLRHERADKPRGDPAHLGSDVRSRRAGASPQRAGSNHGRALHR